MYVRVAVPMVSQRCHPHILEELALISAGPAMSCLLVLRSDIGPHFLRMWYSFRNRWSPHEGLTESGLKKGAYATWKGTKVRFFGCIFKFFLNKTSGYKLETKTKTRTSCSEPQFK